MAEQKSFSFMKLNKEVKTEPAKEFSLDDKKKLLDQACEEHYISTVDALRKRKVSDQDFLKLIKSLDSLQWALRASDFDRMVYNSEVERELKQINEKLDRLLKIKME